MSKFIRLMLDYWREVFIAADQLFNALIPPFDGTISFAGETLSARSWRAYRDGRIFGKIFMPVIDALFFWQPADPQILNEDGVPIKSHCQRAYWKEVRRRHEPSEYAEAALKLRQ